MKEERRRRRSTEGWIVDDKRKGWTNEKEGFLNMAFFCSTGRSGTKKEKKANH